MGKPSAPKPPNPTTTANAQSKANRDAIIASARVNQVDQYTPYGEIIMSGDPANGTQRIDQTLSPELQKIFDLQTAIAGDLGGQAQTSLQNPFEFDASANREKVEDAYFNRATRLLEPQFERQRRREETRLVNQGLPEGSEAFNDSYYDQLLRGQSETMANLADQAVLQGGNEQNRLYGLESAERIRPINELAAVLTGSQAIQSPQQMFTPTYQQAPANVQGAIGQQYQGQMNAFNNANQNYQAGIGGLFGLGGSVASALPWGAWFSDARLKKNIRYIGNHKGHRLYSFNYLWDNIKRIGVMAQEVIKIKPEAVHNVDGYLAVNYGEL